MSEAAGPIRERITLRPVVLPDDEAFLQDLYATTRDDLNVMIPDESQLRQLLLMQYRGQKVTYAAEYPNASHDIVLLDDESVGRLIVDQRPAAIHGVDLALLPQVRNLESEPLS
ncbi:hypothetical protein BH18ACI3_BH18ACI3_20050 [soil metagenome]